MKKTEAKPIPRDFMIHLYEQIRQDPEAMRSLEGVYQLDITGEHGGIWFLKVTDNSVELGEGVREDATLSVKVDAETLFAMTEKRIAPMKALLTGKIKLQGDLSPLIRLFQMV